VIKGKGLAMPRWLITLITLGIIDIIKFVIKTASESKAKRKVKKESKRLDDIQKEQSSTEKQEPTNGAE